MNIPENYLYGAILNNNVLIKTVAIEGEHKTSTIFLKITVNSNNVTQSLSIPIDRSDIKNFIYCLEHTDKYIIFNNKEIGESSGQDV